MKTKHRQHRSDSSVRRFIGRGLWGYWVLATTIAQMVSLGMIEVISNTANQVAPNDFNTVVTSIGALQGFVLGVFQWLVLRRCIRHAVWWIVATMVGTFLAWIIMMSAIAVFAIINASALRAMTMTTCIKGIAVFGIGLGIVVGFTQWLVLQAHFRGAAWWIVANALAWSSALTVALLGVGMVESGGFHLHSAAIGAAISGTIRAIVGTITGVALVWLFVRRSPQPG